MFRRIRSRLWQKMFTHLRNTLKTVKHTVHKNFTLSLPEPLLRQFRVYAVSRNQSMTKLMAEAIRMIMDKESERLRANEKMIARMKNSPDRGTGGVITWTREELHER